ncbi:MAG: hypothetical protein KO202_01725 [Methanobacteriaceae archaeon]|jgi:hypothetical protein|nr:hypothetical protein [Methanobacteriaceae archaeon]
MKLKLAIIYGILSWLLIYLISLNLEPYYIDNNPYINIFIPISTIIVSIIFGILYIREFNENEVKEGFILGIIFFICDLLLDNIYVLIVGETGILNNYPLHIISMLLLFPLITTLLGYLAHMKIELN